MTSDIELEGRSVLIVDDHEPHRTLLVNYLGALGCRTDGAGGGNEALEKLTRGSYDLVLLDLRMDDLDGMEVLTRAQTGGIMGNCVMMSAEGTISHAVEAIRLGAKDFLVKPFELEALHATIRRVLDTRRADGDEGKDPRLEWRDQHAPAMIGEHASLLEIFLVLERIAHTDCTVLVTGESGTGKELVARAIHHASGRSEKPFVPVNCGAIPETLIESELFGHARGAFSGATSAREGRFAVADGGTLFLDEIGEMSLSVQVKFLRVLQEQEFVPVGETRPRRCDVRIIAATNKNLEKMADEGSFREDLFYRLNLIPIHLPSLRDRRDDVPRLAQHFADVLRQRRDATATGFTDDALGAMMAYSWPGNVRELENTVERMMLLHTGEGLLTLADLPPKIQAEARRAAVAPASMPETSLSSPPAATSVPEVAAPTSEVLPFARRVDDPPAPPTPADTFSGEPAASGVAPTPPPAPSPTDFVLPQDGIDLRKAVEEFEMGLIDQALERTGGNKNQASILLGMNRTTLVEKLRKRKRKRSAEGG